MAERESMPYDVVIVGAGPAGLDAGISQSRGVSPAIVSTPASRHQ